MANKTALVILDGWGYGKKDHSDAIHEARTPFFDSLIETSPNATLLTDGENVGLPEGQMGNSEVGHLNIGAGRIVDQELAKINKAIADKSFSGNEKWKEALEKAKAKNEIHLLGLISDGGVHSHYLHIAAMAKMAHEAGIEKIWIHAFTDGRDTDPKGGAKYFQVLENELSNTNAQVATVIGRYFAMDRDLRWERIAKAYELLVNGTGAQGESAIKVCENSYAQNITDEFIEPVILQKEGIIKSGDVVVCANFRTDRCRQISRALTQENFSDHGMKKLKLEYYTMTNYDKNFEDVSILFDKDNLTNTLGEVISANGSTQLRMAETEKYPHVTFFFSGGREATFEGEDRAMANSPKVATYDLQPEMSAKELTDIAIKKLEENQPDFLCLNYANPDMVGHTGVFEAIKKAVETTDECLQRLVECGEQLGYSFIIIADHGNADKAINEDGSPNTAHTTNPVPVILINDEYTKINNGILADVAPTVLKLMGIPQPKEMTGKSLV